MIVIQKNKYPYIQSPDIFELIQALSKMESVSVKILLFDSRTREIIVTQEKEENTTFSLLGGRLKQNESIVDCGIRELDEETRKTLSPKQKLDVRTFMCLHREFCFWNILNRRAYYIFMIPVNLIPSLISLDNIILNFSVRDTSRLSKESTEIWDLHKKNFEEVFENEFTMSKRISTVLKTVKHNNIEYRTKQFIESFLITKEGNQYIQSVHT